MYWFSNLAVVFKKQEISQQVLLLLGYTRPLEPTNERRSHQNAGFSMSFPKNFRDDTLGPSQREGATSSRTHPKPGLWPGAGRKLPKP